MKLGSLAFAALAVVAGATLLGLHDLSSDQFLAILTGAGIHVSAVTVPGSGSAAGSTSSSSAGGGPGPQPMRRLLIGSILLGVGYLLVYAGVSEGGKWATNPWGAPKGGQGAPEASPAHPSSGQGT